MENSNIDYLILSDRYRRKSQRLMHRDSLLATFYHNVAEGYRLKYYNKGKENDVRGRTESTND